MSTTPALPHQEGGDCCLYCLCLRDEGHNICCVKSPGKRRTMSDQKSLTGKFAIVTGAAGGLGEAIAKTLAREGASVAVTDINIQDAKRVQSEIEKRGGLALAIQFDVTQSRQVTEMVRQVLDRWGAIDILVNNAGGFKTFSPLFEIAEEE